MFRLSGITKVKFCGEKAAVRSATCNRMNTARKKQFRRVDSMIQQSDTVIMSDFDVISYHFVIKNYIVLHMLSFLCVIKWIFDL